MLLQQLIGFGAASSGAPATVAFGAAAENGGNATSYSFTSHAIGTASATRYIVVACHYKATAYATGVTVAGTACTMVVEAQVSNYRTQLWITNSAITTGTTATVAVTLGVTADNCAVATWALDRLTSTTAVDTESVTTDNTAMSIVAPNGGALVVAATHRASSFASSTITGATERYDDQIAAEDCHYFGGDAQLTGDTTVTADHSGIGFYTACAAVWG